MIQYLNSAFDLWLVIPLGLESPETLRGEHRSFEPKLLEPVDRLRPWIPMTLPMTLRPALGVFEWSGVNTCSPLPSHQRLTANSHGGH